MNPTTKVALEKAGLGFSPDDGVWLGALDMRTVRPLGPDYDGALRYEVRVIATEERIPRILAALTTPVAPSHAHAALEWLVHLHHGVSKGGGAPTPSEWDDAYANAETALTTPTPYALTDEERAAITTALESHHQVMDDADESDESERDARTLRNLLARSDSAPLVSLDNDPDGKHRGWSALEHAEFGEFIDGASAPPESITLRPPATVRVVGSGGETAEFAVTEEVGSLRVTAKGDGGSMLEIVTATGDVKPESMTQAQLEVVRDVIDDALRDGCSMSPQSRYRIINPIITRLRGGAL